MLNKKSINQKIIIVKIHNKIDNGIYYQPNQLAIVKGIKRIDNFSYIYLVEFLNYNRDWIIEKEFKLCKKESKS